MARLGGTSAPVAFGVPNAQITGQVPVKTGWGWKPAKRTWFQPTSSASMQRGTGPALSSAQKYDPPLVRTPPFGGHSDTVPRRNSMGADGIAPTFGRVMTNPIGAGIFAPWRPRPWYGPSGQYVNGAIWWTAQEISTSVELQGLYDADVIDALLAASSVTGFDVTTG